MEIFFKISGRSPPPLLTALALLTVIFYPVTVGLGAGDSAVSASENGGSRPIWTVNDTFNVSQIAAVDVSPDGRMAAYAVRKAVMAPDRSEYETQIYLTDIQGNRTLQLTREGPSNDGPQWSPDGTRIAFISARSGAPQIWAIPVTGGEAVQVTDAETGVGMFKWSPDGKSLAFLAPDAPTPEQEMKTKEMDDAQVVDRDVYVNGQARTMNHLWLVSAQENSSGRHDLRRLTGGNFSVASWDWSPDGSYIAFLCNPGPGAQESESATLARVGVNRSGGSGDESRGSVSTLMELNCSALSLSCSPDGRSIAYSTSKECNIVDIFLISSRGGKPAALAEGLDMCLSYEGMIGWSKDGRYLYVPVGKGTESEIVALPVDGGEPEVLLKAGSLGSLGSADSIRLSWSRDMIGFVMENSTRPPEAYISRLDDPRPIKVSNVNGDDRLPLRAIGKTEVIRWNSTDGKVIEGLLIYPAGYQPKEKYPLLVEAHGGPNAAFLQFFPGSLSWPICPAGTLSSQGYFLLRPNIRGSTGYGPEFTRAGLRDWGGMDFQDLMAGVDHLIDAGLADPDRLGILGQSYGGYMAAWAVTQTDRFGAAVVVDGITDLVSNDGTSDIPHDLPNAFGCHFWDDYDLYLEHSPIFHVKNVTTPTLVLHGAEDMRVPTSQGREFYSALKKRGVTAQMVLYPRSGHFPGEPKLQRDLHQRELEWFNMYVPAKETA